MIEIRHLSKTFKLAKGDIHALSDINLTINDGEIFGIIGLSGAGKSTLVRCINYLETPTEGEVIFNGTNLGTLTPAELRQTRKKISMIFQNFNLFAQRTALKNVRFPLEIVGTDKAEATKKARELLELVGLSDRENSYPSQLSGGQKQRVAIARALATNPSVLLCDEATSALDPDTTRQVLALLKDINRKMGVTIIVITHEMKVIEQICDKVAIIDRSRIAETGEVKDVFLSPKSQIGRKLILPQSSESVESIENGQVLRIVFSGENTNEPIMANLVLECRTPINILAADTKTLDGKSYGQMILEIPSDEAAKARIENYLRTHGITYEERGQYVSGN